MAAGCIRAGGRLLCNSADLDALDAADRIIDTPRPPINDQPVRLRHPKSSMQDGGDVSYDAQISTLIGAVEDGRSHLVADHDDADARDLLRRLDGAMDDYRRWLVASRHVAEQLAYIVDQLRRASERGQAECLWCLDIACVANEALVRVGVEGIES